MKGESSVCDTTFVLMDLVRVGVDSEVEARGPNIIEHYVSEVRIDTHQLIVACSCDSN